MLSVRCIKVLNILCNNIFQVYLITAKLTDVYDDEINKVSEESEQSTGRRCCSLHATVWPKYVEPYFCVLRLDDIEGGNIIIHRVHLQYFNASIRDFLVLISISLAIMYGENLNIMALSDGFDIGYLTVSRFNEAKSVTHIIILNQPHNS